MKYLNVIFFIGMFLLADIIFMLPVPKEVLTSSVEIYIVYYILKLIFIETAIIIGYLVWKNKK